MLQVVLIVKTINFLQQATECLKKHTYEIKMENQRLRSELQQIIEATNDLQSQKKKLDKQYRSLLREHQFNQDLQRLRGSVFRELDSSSTHSFSFGASGSGRGI